MLKKIIDLMDKEKYGVEFLKLTESEKAKVRQMDFNNDVDLEFSFFIGLLDKYIEKEDLQIIYVTSKILTQINHQEFENYVRSLTKIQKQKLLTSIKTGQSVKEWNQLNKEEAGVFKTQILSSCLEHFQPSNTKKQLLAA